MLSLGTDHSCDIYGGGGGGGLKFSASTPVLPDIFLL